VQKNTKNISFGAGTKLKLLGVNVASIGDAHGRTPGSRAYSFSDEVHEVYKKIVVSETGRHLLGAVLVGDTDDYGNLLQLALNGIKLPAHPDTLILPHREGSASAALGIDVLPDSAQICSCNNVSKGDLHAVIADGATALGDLKACTKASTSCGGCAPLVKQVLDAE
jgi:nitrite reductase (NADH) large subunit